MLKSMENMPGFHVLIMPPEDSITLKVVVMYQKDFSSVSWDLPPHPCTRHELFMQDYLHDWANPISKLFIAEIFGGIGMCLWCCWKDLDEQELMQIFFSWKYFLCFLAWGKNIFIIYGKKREKTLHQCIPHSWKVRLGWYHDSIWFFLSYALCDMIF